MKFFSGRPWVIWAVWIVVSACSLPCRAETRIPPAYVNIAQAFGIPPVILYAVALTESGLRLTSGQVRPWPWTLHVNGQAERYTSQEAALQALQSHLTVGRRSLDIGLMQINWRWHQKALVSPRMALDPYHNLRTGARLLRDLYQKSGAWLVAIGRYHAPASTRQARARAKVYRARVSKQLAWLQDKP